MSAAPNLINILIWLIVVVVIVILIIIVFKFLINVLFLYPYGATEITAIPMLYTENMGQGFLDLHLEGTFFP